MNTSSGAFGERKLVTVLFADVVDSTSMAEKVDPEDVADIMNGAFEFLNTTVSKYGGIVARLMGDAVFAIFGAPVAHEDDAERAVRSGLEMLSYAEEYERWIRRQYGLDFNIRVGINTGLAVLDVVGNQVKTEYTAMGETTNIGSRLQQIAEPGTVLVSLSTYRQVKNLFDFEPLGAVQIRGKSSPVEVFRVLSAKALAWKKRGLEGLVSPLVGRQEHLETLFEKTGDLPSGSGAVVTVIGDAGLGKSRLIEEFREKLITAFDKNVQWLESRSISYGQSITYYPWREIIRQSIAARGDDSPETVRARLKLKSGQCGLSDEHFPFLEALLAVESEASLEKVKGYEGEALVQRVTEAIRSYLCAVVQDMPTVFIFDDMHWADAATIDLIQAISNLVEKLPMLIIGLLRPDRDAPGWQLTLNMEQQLGGRFTKIILQPLSGAEALQLIDNLLQLEELPESLNNLILSKAEGNPFFVEEIIRTLIDMHLIQREGARWRASSELQEISIPDTLAGILSARIDRLDEETKKVVQVASVIGRTFPWRVLNTLYVPNQSTEGITNLQVHLERLGQADIVYEWADQPELQYIFKHALTQEAAYNSILVKQRKDIHRRIGKILEEFYPNQLDELAAELAHHYWKGEDWASAAEWSMRAGEQAMRVYALREAAGHYQRAVEAIEKIPQELPDKLLEAILAWVQASYKFTPYKALIEKLEQAEAIARVLDDEHKLARALQWIANTHLREGFNTRAMPVLIENFRLANKIGDERLSVIPNYYWAIFIHERDPHGSLKQFERVIELARKYGNRDIEALAIAARARAHALIGEYTLVEQDLRHAMEIARSLNSPIILTDIHIIGGYAYLDMGKLQQGLEFSQRGAEMALHLDAPDCASTGLFCVGIGNLHRQNLNEAEKAFQQAIRLAASSGAETFKNQSEGGLAIAKFYSGDWEAIKAIEKAKENARTLDDEYGAALFSQVLGSIYAQLKDFVLAEHNLKEALDYYQRAGIRYYTARTLQLLGELSEMQRQPQ